MFVWLTAPPIGIKEARACLFAGLAVCIAPKSGVRGLPRYDVLLLIALVIQIMTFTITANRKHIKAYFHLPPRQDREFLADFFLLDYC